MLIGKGYSLTIYDQNVHLSKLVGANREYIEQRIPHLSELITDDLEKALTENEVIIINQRKIHPCFRNLLEAKGAVIDLVRIPELEDLPNYQGLCW